MDEERSDQTMERACLKYYAYVSYAYLVLFCVYLVPSGGSERGGGPWLVYAFVGYGRFAFDSEPFVVGAFVAYFVGASAVGASVAYFVGACACGCSFSTIQARDICRDFCSNTING